jgi:hypothetical protein
LRDDELMAKSLDYVFNPIYHQEAGNVVIRLENGMAQVKDIGTGFMMIQKSVIRKMMAKYPETKYKNNVAGYGQGNMNDYFYSLFDCCIDPVSRVYLSEDYLFCKRWIDIGGELWLDVNTNLNHTGIIDYKGCLGLVIGEVDVLNKDAQILRQQQLQTPPTAKPAGTSNITTAVVANTNVAANGQSKRKKKNKKNKKNNNNNSVGNTSNVMVDTDGGNECKDGDGSDNGEDDSDDEKEEKLENEEIVSGPSISQAINGNHC